MLHSVALDRYISKLSALSGVLSWLTTPGQNDRGSLINDSTPVQALRPEVDGKLAELIGGELELRVKLSRRVKPALEYRRPNSRQYPRT